MTRVGRLIAVVLFIALMVPAALLARGWSLAAGRRAVASAGVEFVPVTPEATAQLARQATHAHRVRLLGLLLGVALVVSTVVVFAEASVFLWVPALAVGSLAGVLLAEATRPRPRWATTSPPRRPRRSEQISLWLLWTMRGAVAGVVLTALLQVDDLASPVVATATAVPLAGWLLAETALLRVLLRPLPAEGADVPVDEAQRTWTAHLSVAAASVLALLPLGALLLRAAIDLGDRVSSDGAGLLPVALVAGGFSAIIAGLVVAGFLLTWLRPVRQSSPALA
ncbi:hypothetical protein GCM10023328_30190 [Modestobacter marinus]|uniref:Uncharacterized protein n=1 Tax=Modestobacter marinus TaxID=477641 RepID=A0A846LKU5_9ACTN|nr:hypothetical protein [Modestobacter marinus]NIH65945.1 hypothetical protein [Modestobacter marinus]GGL68348.1 hypothetical protein GCM10011589_25850 [Modestobacter marinus]